MYFLLLPQRLFEFDHLGVIWFLYMRPYVVRVNSGGKRKQRQEGEQFPWKPQSNRNSSGANIILDIYFMT